MLEEQQTTLGVLSDMAQAAKAQKRTMAEMKIENIDATLEEIQDLGDQMRQVNEAVAQPVGMFNDIDEGELEAELAELEAAELDSQLLEPAPVPAGKAAVAAPGEALPAAPTGAAKAKAKTQEELELEALQAEMAL